MESNAEVVTKLVEDAQVVVVPPPKIVERVTHKVRAEDLVEVQDHTLVLAVDIQRQSKELLDKVEIEEGQKLFPYNVLPRLFVGWQSVGFISSLELKMTSESPLPQIIIRFAEKMAPEAVKELDPALRAQIEQSIALVRQYPFVKVESPLLP